MNDEHHHALASIQFSSVLSPDEIWGPLNHHVDGLHPRAVQAITRAVDNAVRQPTGSPTGLVLSGEKGVGKTHMLGWLRQHVHERDGWFFMPKLVDGMSFWAGAVHGIVNRLLGSESGQLRPMLGALADRAGCGPELRMRLCGMLEVSRADLDTFLERIAALDEQVAVDCADTLRALVLYRGRGRSRDIGHAFLVLDEGIDPAEVDAWGFGRGHRDPQLKFGDLTRLFALTGPVVLAIDQIDTVIAQSADTDEDLLANRLADALVRMREETTRTLIVVACIPRSWELLATRSVNSTADRFTVLELSTAMPGAAVATAIVERHLGGVYGEIGFAPPYPTWPVLPSAFDRTEVTGFTPRRLLQRVEEHVRQCLDADTATEMVEFVTTTADPVARRVAPTSSELAVFDKRFAQARAEADVAAPLDPDREDTLMYPLLYAALRSYVLEQNGGGATLNVDTPSGVTSALHARLRRTIDEATEDEEHWSFRAIAHPHPRAVQTRLRSAVLEAGITPGSTRRRLVVLRNTPFSRGPVTVAQLAELEAAHGVALPISEDDLRTFSALESMFADGQPGFLSWLEHRRPASNSPLLTRVLPGPDDGGPATGIDEPTSNPLPGDPMPRAGGPEPGDPGPGELAPGDQDPDDPARHDPADSGESAGSGDRADLPHDQTPPDGPAVYLGRDTVSGKDFRVPLLLLRKHTAVFAGSGSGKTVLLRRLVEEAALHGVSSILIDTNNDLARLGDAWPSPPGTWSAGDRDRAQRYLDGTDVVVWTPRREAGRPLALNPLPDFSVVREDPDEFRTSIDASVAGLVPRTGLTPRKEATGRAVLTEAMTHFARGGGSDLGEFVTLLATLPDGVSTIRNALALAQSMAEELKAAMINDPLFGGAGEHLDPSLLFTPANGKRARVSVISCIGLPTDAQRQTFVNQLQLALFAWIKRNPAGDRPLGGLLVLDEAQTFVPSRGTTASSESTLKLATQARKYGLGMVYATQAPKALHNLVTGNAATQLIGLLNASIQIQAATELARAKGGRVEDISRLPAGRFYAATEGTGFGKIQVPMCLSHHPNSALTEDEVLGRARR
ncbi:AAA family ATPase [Nocardia sp. NPDC057663]|uniref:AAA family ATPase n=1 Tax=Nocardia sp. NPDC057663 TaxID=3346201 RepID=UPI003671CF76